MDLGGDNNVGLFIFSMAVKETKGKVFQFQASAEAKSEGKVGRFVSELPAP